jgi:hypothetical protein
LSFAKLPEDIVESASIIRAPLLEYHLKYLLPYGFSSTAALRTNIITWHFSLTAGWNQELDRFAFGIGYEVAYFTGKLTQFGFDSRIKGWINYPSLTIGYRFDKFTVSLRSNLILLTNITQLIEDIQIQSDRNYYSGFSLALYLEQLFWKDNYFLIGIKSSYTKFYYPLWAAYSTFNRYFWIPEITVGFIL